MDQLDLVIKLRELLAASDTANAAVSGNFDDPELEIVMAALRPVIGETAELTFQALQRLERQPGFVKKRADALARRI